MQKKFKVVLKAFDSKVKKLYKKIDEISSNKMRVVSLIQKDCKHKDVISTHFGPDTSFLCLACGRYDLFSKLEGLPLFFKDPAKEVDRETYLENSKELHILTEHYIDQ